MRSSGAPGLLASRADVLYQQNLGYVSATDPVFGIVNDPNLDQTAKLNTFLDAAAGKTAVFPPWRFKITDALTPPAGTEILMYPLTVIVQATEWTTAWKPCFDLLDVPGVTIRGGELRYEGTRINSNIAGSFRATAWYDYSAGVWTNSDNTTVIGTKVYGFHNGVVVTGYNGGASWASFKTKNVVIRDLKVDQVDFGLLAGGFDGLILDNPTGSYTIMATGTGGSPPPSHLVYITHPAGALNRGFQQFGGNAWDGTNSYAYQYKGMRGGTIIAPIARNCPSYVNVIDSEGVTMHGGVSEDETSTVERSIAIAAGCKRVKVYGAVCKAGAGIAKTLIGIDSTSEDCEITDTDLTGGFTTNSSTPAVIIGGLRNRMVRHRYRNATAGVLSYGTSFTGTDGVLIDPETADSNWVAIIQAAAIRPVVEFDAARTGVPNPTSGGNRSIRIIAGATTTRVRRKPYISTFSVAAAGTASINAADVTHAIITAAGNITVANPYEATIENEMSIEVFNNTAGAITITWGAAFIFDGTAPSPGAGLRKTVRFMYDGTNWREVSRSG